MQLSELEPRLMKRNADGSMQPVAAVVEADGLIFLCPKCAMMKDGNAGVHSIICWRPRVPAGVAPGPGRWEFQGDSIDTLTLVAPSSSIALTSEGGCKAHFYIRNGRIEFC